MYLKYSLVKNHLVQNNNEHTAKPQRVRSHNLDSIIQRMMRVNPFVSRDSAIAIINTFFNTVARITEDGETIHTDLFRTHFSISGAFDSVADRFDPKRHTVNINLTPGKELRQVLPEVKTHKVNYVDTAPRIYRVRDTDKKTVDKTITPDKLIEIIGIRMKIQGDNERTGILFINEQDKTSYKVETFIENRPSRILAIVPLLPKGTYTLVVRTQSTRGGKVLKEPQEVRFIKPLKAL